MIVESVPYVFFQESLINSSLNKESSLALWERDKVRGFPEGLNVVTE